MAWKKPKDDVPVADAASAAGVSPRRMRRLLADGVIDGSRDDRGVWSVNRASLARWHANRLPAVRPLNPGSLRLLADALAIRLGADASPAWDAAPARDRHRALDRVDRLAAVDAPADLLRAWFRNHAQPVVLHVALSAQAVLNSPDIAPAGISHPLSRLAPAGEVEICASAAAVDRLAAAAPGPLRVIAHAHRNRSLGDVILDLADHRDARADGEIERLVRTPISPAAYTSSPTSPVLV